MSVRGRTALSLPRAHPQPGSPRGLSLPLLPPPNLLPGSPLPLSPCQYCQAALLRSPSTSLSLPPPARQPSAPHTLLTSCQGLGSIGHGPSLPRQSAHVSSCPYSQVRQQGAEGQVPSLVFRPWKGLEGTTNAGMEGNHMQHQTPKRVPLPSPCVFKLLLLLFEPPELINPLSSSTPARTLPRGRAPSCHTRPLPSGPARCRRPCAAVAASPAAGQQGPREREGEGVRCWQLWL